MDTRFIGSLAIAALLVPTVGLRAPDTRLGTTLPTPARMVLQPESRLWVEGSSTVRDFECTAGEIDGEIRTDPAAPAAPLGELDRVVAGAEITVPVAGLDCGNDTMNEHMRKALAAERHPFIHFRLDSLFVAPTEEDQALVELRGRLSIAGQERPFTALVDLTADGRGAYTVQGAQEIDMTEWGVKPPRLMLGTLKVHDRVVVRFDVRFGP